MNRGKLLAAGLMGCLLQAPLLAQEEAGPAEEWKPHCVDAVVIARNIQIRGIPWRRYETGKIEISAYHFDVERVLHGQTKAKQLTIHAHTYAPRDLSGQRWLFMLSGSDKTGWKEVESVSGVVRDLRGRDVYPLHWPMKSDEYSDRWLPKEVERFIGMVEYDRSDEYRVCERYPGADCFRAPAVPGRLKESIKQHGIMLDEMPKLMAARTEACLPASEGAPAPSAEHYRVHGDFESLAWAEKRLRKGMTRDEVRALLGPPDYSPTDGQDYYGSDATSRSEDPNQEWSMVLVIGYREIEYKKAGIETTLTDRLQSWGLGPVGE